MLDTKLLETLVCPQCHHKVVYYKSENHLVCDICSFAFPIEDDIPIMLLEAAQPFTARDA